MGIGYLHHHYGANSTINVDDRSYQGTKTHIYFSYHFKNVDASVFLFNGMQFESERPE